MNTLITGTSQGIGKALAELFLAGSHVVIGIDRQCASISHKNYTHYQLDIRDYEHLPDLPPVQILINNAGTQNENDIDTNLKALIHITEKYGVQPQIHSILHIGSAYWPIRKTWPCALLPLARPATAWIPAAY